MTGRDTIPPDILATVGRAIFGNQWQTPMAILLNISNRTVRRWANEGAPEWIAAPLRGAIDVQQRALGEADNFLWQHTPEFRRTNKTNIVETPP